MPTVEQLNSSPEAMTNSLNLPTKQYGLQIGNFFQNKDKELGINLNIIHHIEALKTAAHGGPLIFPNLNNSSRPSSTLLAIANCGEHSDVGPSSLKSKSLTLSRTIDPASIPGNLRKHEQGKFSNMGILHEKNNSRDSSYFQVVKSTHTIPVNSRLKTRRKSNKFSKKKCESGEEKNLTRSLSQNETPKFTQNSIHVYSKTLCTEDVDVLSALCKGMTIQQKGPAINIKTTSCTKKTSATYGCCQPVVKALLQKDIKKSLIASEQLHRKRSLGSKSAERLVKVFQSEQQSGVISDLGLAVPCAPPATPTADQLKKVEYVPSLQDIRAQRSFRQRLQAMELKAKMKESRKNDTYVAAEKLSLKERKAQQKQFQRQQIYALNQVMTDLENENFHNFMKGFGMVSGGV